MKKLLLSLSLLLMSFGAFASDYTLADLGINAPWVQASDPSSNSSSGFVTIINNGDVNDVLERVSTPRAGRVELINKQGQSTSQIYIGGSSDYYLFSNQPYYAPGNPEMSQVTLFFDNIFFRVVVFEPD